MADLEVGKLKIAQLGSVGQNYLSRAQTQSLLNPNASAAPGQAFYGFGQSQVHGGFVCMIFKSMQIFKSATFNF